LSGRFFSHGFSSNIYGLIKGYDENSLAIPVVDNTFLRERFAISTIISIVLLLTLACLLIPYFAYGVHLTAIQVELLRSEGLHVFEKIAAAATICISAYSGLYFILFQTPLPYKKNAYSIRWGFLSIISNEYPHPRARTWLDE